MTPTSSMYIETDCSWSSSGRSGGCASLAQAGYRIDHITTASAAGADMSRIRKVKLTPEPYITDGRSAYHYQHACSAPVWANSIHGTFIISTPRSYISVQTSFKRKQCI